MMKLRRVSVLYIHTCSLCNIYRLTLHYRDPYIDYFLVLLYFYICLSSYRLFIGIGMISVYSNERACYILKKKGPTRLFMETIIYFWLMVVSVICYTSLVI